MMTDLHPLIGLPRSRHHHHHQLKYHKLCQRRIYQKRILPFRYRNKNRNKNRCRILPFLLRNNHSNHSNHNSQSARRICQKRTRPLRHRNKNRSRLLPFLLQKNHSNRNSQFAQTLRSFIQKQPILVGRTIDNLRRAVGSQRILPLRLRNNNNQGNRNSPSAQTLHSGIQTLQIIVGWTVQSLLPKLQLVGNLLRRAVASTRILPFRLRNSNNSQPAQALHPVIQQLRILVGQTLQRLFLNLQQVLDNLRQAVVSCPFLVWSQRLQRLHPIKVQRVPQKRGNERNQRELRIKKEIYPQSTFKRKPHQRQLQPLKNRLLHFQRSHHQRTIFHKGLCLVVALALSKYKKSTMRMKRMTTIVSRQSSWST
mmetsp:Transcript_23970/g.58587  ORF Transcript_23970/g.58587 Transcript_23970/m.58587 type:complete len:367 (+) Transcript_23970:395-1495(+)